MLFFFFAFLTDFSVWRNFLGLIPPPRVRPAEPRGWTTIGRPYRLPAEMDLNRSSSSEDEPTSPATPPQSTATPQNVSGEQKLPQPSHPPHPLHPPSQPQQPPQSSGTLLCQELLSVCNSDYAAQQLSAARKTSDPLTPMWPPGPNAVLLTPPTTSGSAGASNVDPVLLKLQAGSLQANVPEAKRVRQVKAAERLQPKISPPAPDVLKMLQVPR